MSHLAFDTIVLAGGRSSRLGSVPKAELVVEGVTLLARTLAAVSSSRRVVVVGPRALKLPPTGVLHAQEEPPFSGPAAAIAGGLAALRHDAELRGEVGPGEVTLVLACDMPGIGPAVPRLLRGLNDNPEADGVVAVDDDRLQPLAAGFRTSRLASVIAPLEREDSLGGLPVFRLIDELNLAPIDVPPGSTADVDTWEDAQRLGAAIADEPQREETP